MIGVPVAEKPADNTPRGRLRALYDWVTGAVAVGYFVHHLRQFGA